MKTNFFAKYLLLIGLCFFQIDSTFATTQSYKDDVQQCYGPLGCYLIPTVNPNVGMYQLAIETLIKKLEANPSLVTKDGYSGSVDVGGSHPYTAYFSNGVMLYYACANGDTLYFGYDYCPNKAINKPECNKCANGSTFTNNKCECNNSASNSPACNLCGDGLSMQNNLCVCANGATNPTACNICPSSSNMVNGQCTCNNGADVFQQCNACKSGQVFDASGVCKDGCSTTNACGQTIQGYMNNGQCQLSTAPGTNPNDSCIINFNVTTNTVNPNGSVEFSWTMVPLPNGVSSICGFVDLTTPTPRPIPGLQNLDPKIDRIRINNVQATTRFCLVCQFYNLLNNNALLGEAVRHQWVRVIRVGEN